VKTIGDTRVNVSDRTERSYRIQIEISLGPRRIDSTQLRSREGG